MQLNKFPPLVLANWEPTRNSIILFSQVIGKIRRALAPKQKHWWHVSLNIASTGLTTGPIAYGALTFALGLDFTTHRLVLTTSTGGMATVALRGQSIQRFTTSALAMLKNHGIDVEIDTTPFSATQPLIYDIQAVSHMWQAISQIDLILKEFQGSLRRETGPVVLWPHHFDLAMLWFSGRLVPGQDPNNEEYADEQMNFGFSTGDGMITDAYFYITAYPTPEGLTNTKLPEGAYWQTAGFKGAILPYQALVDAADPKALLLDYFSTVHAAGKRLMQ